MHWLQKGVEEQSQCIKGSTPSPAPCGWKQIRSVRTSVRWPWSPGTLMATVVLMVIGALWAAAPKLEEWFPADPEEQLLRLTSIHDGSMGAKVCFLTNEPLIKSSGSGHFKTAAGAAETWFDINFPQSFCGPTEHRTTQRQEALHALSPMANVSQFVRTWTWMKM